MTDRLTASTITDAELDELYTRLALAEQEADTSVAAAAHLATLVGKRSEKAEKTAKAQCQRARIAETELRVLRTGLRANGADPTQIQNLWAQIRLRNRQWREEKQRAAQAEAERDGAYRERAQLLALLAALHPSVIAPAPDIEDEDGWQILYLRIGARQASWHIAPRDADLYTHVEHVPADDHRAQWDGHTTEEKYAHIGEHAVRLYAEARGRVETRALVDDAIRQLDAERSLNGGMVVQSYREHGKEKWVFRCWGTDDGCDGYLSLDHTSQQWAERARDRHLAEDHQPKES